MKKNIFFVLAFCAAVLTACTEDFKDWADPQHNGAETAQTTELKSITAINDVKLGDVADEYVKLFDAQVTSSQAADVKYQIILSKGDKKATIMADAEGRVLKEELQTIVTDFFGLAPTVRDIDATVYALYTVNGQTVRETAQTVLHVAPEAPFIDTAYYVVGSMNGWNETSTEFELTNGGGDVYENPVFTCTIPAEKVTSNLEFKVFPKSTLGNWDTCLAYGDVPGQFNYNNVGGNFNVAYDANAKSYVLTFNMLEGTWNAKAVSFGKYLWVPGDANGWKFEGGRIESPNQDGHYTGYIYVKGGFKFTNKDGWDGTNYGWGADATSLSSDGGAGNLWLGDDAAVYYVDVDLTAMKYSAQKVETMGIIGDFNGWNGDVKMTWDDTEKCFVAENAGITTGGWKFRLNADWGVNLGGTINDLIQNGDDLAVYGNTIKLYPLRDKSDKIYCTVK